MEPFSGTGSGAAQEWLDDWSADADERAVRARAFSDRVAELWVTASGAEGAVRVTVAASGAMTDLRLDERVKQWPAARLAQQILAVMRQAQGELAASVAAAAAQTVGEHSPLGRDVVDGYATRFPAQQRGAQQRGAQQRGAQQWGHDRAAEWYPGGGGR
jgi:DNA-binding protein YbaB